MKPADVKNNTCIDFKKEINNKDPEFKVGDHVRIPKYKNIFAKGYMPNWSEKIFVIKKLKILRHGHILLVILMAKKLFALFMKKNYRVQITKNIG